MAPPESPYPTAGQGPALWKIVQGSAVDVLPTLEQGSVQTVVTSPPYFGHRRYAPDVDESSEVGRESTVGAYVEKLVEVFGLVRESLSDTGTLWLNLGDTYRKKQLLGVPWRVALALQDDGWFLRSDIIWHKPNAMPASIKDRPTPDHEYIFLLTKSASYFYDQDAIREPHKTFTAESKMKGGRRHLGVRNGTPEAGKNGGQSNLHDGRWDQAFHPLGRNKRSVWSVPLGKFRGAHFAVFPERLIEPCVLAGSQPGELVLDPFAGAATTGLVATRNGRRFLGVELSAEYAELARQRLDDSKSSHA